MSARTANGGVTWDHLQEGEAAVGVKRKKKKLQPQSVSASQLSHGTIQAGPNSYSVVMDCG
jgi:hypothetical protein